ncbi:hypothetical protein [Sphingomonas morindae]|uniref:Uncharacterized protein n=1 Tax=Sphingomonas morindae TaxID=1541170 RepID=A0ABY4X9Y5_9SPHN|nr:hypothetical protein [Sphingomonas morindae]USI73782.1 hypothetical protein LHA26_04755 [Sphingomonas morindae]
MTEKTDYAERHQGGTAAVSTAAAGGMTPATRPPRERAADDVPLAEGAVRSGAYDDQSGRSPEEAREDPQETRAPLDSRAHFGGDGARYEAPPEGAARDAAREARTNATTPGDIGHDPTATSR